VSGLAAINKIIRLKQKKIDQDKKKETRAIMMVIINSGLNFFLRFPEILMFVSSSYGIVGFILGNSILSSNVSSIFISLSYFFYILSFTSNVVIFYIFNPKFKQLFIFWPHFVKEK
jgi:hypothetical protein